MYIKNWLNNKTENTNIPRKKQKEKGFLTICGKKTNKTFLLRKQIWKKIYVSSMFPAVLLTTGKIWKQSMSTSGWVDQEDMVYTHTME